MNLRLSDEKQKKTFHVDGTSNFVRFLKKKKSIKCNIYTYKINKLTQEKFNQEKET